TSFFFSFEKEPEIDRRLHSGAAHGVERGEHGNDRGLIVTGRTGEEAPFRVGRLRAVPIDIVPGVVPHRWLPRLALPLRWVDRLSVVMGIERDGSFRVRRGEICDDNRRSALDRQNFCNETSL